MFSWSLIVFNQNRRFLSFIEKTKNVIFRLFWLFFIKIRNHQFWSKTIKHHEDIFILGSFMSIYNQNDFFIEIRGFTDIFEFFTVKLWYLYIKNSENQKKKTVAAIILIFSKNSFWVDLFAYFYNFWAWDLVGTLKIVL